MRVMEFGQRVLARRTEIGVGQSELARAAGVSRQVVYQWESNGTKPEKVEVMLAVAGALRTSISFLFGETDDPRPAPQWHTGEGPSSEWESRVETARTHLAAAGLLLDFNVLPELQVNATTDAHGSPADPSVDPFQENKTKRRKIK